MEDAKEEKENVESEQAAKKPEKKDSTPKPIPIRNYSQDGRQYGYTSKGAIRRVNPSTGRAVPRVRLSKKDRRKMRDEMKAMQTVQEGTK